MNLITTAPVLVYLITLIGGLSGKESLQAMIWLVPPLIVVFGVLGPYFAIQSAVENAVQVVAGEPAGVRLSRILKLPRVIELRVIAVYMTGVPVYSVTTTLYFKKPLSVIPWALTIALVLMLLVMVWTRIFVEREISPLAVEEFHRFPDAPLQEGGLAWVRQRWYLPYAFGLFVLSTLATTGTVLARHAFSAYEGLLASLAMAPESAALVQKTVQEFSRVVTAPLAIIGTFLLVSAALAALQFARHQHRGAQAVQEAIVGLSSGSPRLPAWATTDELGDLARATARAFAALRAFSASLGESAHSLGRSAETLESSNTQQNAVLSRQAAALQETQVTAQEIKQTSLVAAQKAEGVLRQAVKAEDLGRAGAEAIEKSLGSLQEIRLQVTGMASHMKSLEEQAKQIGNITITVKDLADQSNMLALNAAIEAVRSGEHGKGFGVVAREIRSLADQSIQATNRVRGILQDIEEAIRTSVDSIGKGAEKIAGSVEQVRQFGDNIRQLSEIVRENTSSVRQISAAVNQQNEGISQIFQAVSDLSSLMNDTMVRIRATDDATALVRQVADDVSRLIKGNRWDAEAKGGAAP